MLKESDIDTIEEIGQLHGRPIKLIRTLGGFYIAVGYPNGSEEALAAGSHPAIVKFNLKKKYSNIHFHFHKHEHTPEAIVVDYTDKLPKRFEKKGFNLYSVTLLNKKEFFLNRYGTELLKLELDGNKVSVKLHGFVDPELIKNVEQTIKKDIIGE